MKSRLFLAALAALLTGCMAANKHRVACTAADDELLLVPDLFGVRIVFSAFDADRKAICEKLRGVGTAKAAPAAAATSAPAPAASAAK